MFEPVPLDLQDAGDFPHMQLTLPSQIKMADLLKPAILAVKFSSCLCRFAIQVAQDIVKNAAIAEIVQLIFRIDTRQQGDDLC